MGPKIYIDMIKSLTQPRNIKVHSVSLYAQLEQIYWSEITSSNFEFTFNRIFVILVKKLRHAIGIVSHTKFWMAISMAMPIIFLSNVFVLVRISLIPWNRGKTCLIKELFTCGKISLSIIFFWIFWIIWIQYAIYNKRELAKMQKLSKTIIAFNYRW